MKKNIWMKRGKSICSSNGNDYDLYNGWMWKQQNNNRRRGANRYNLSSGGQEVREALQAIADAYNSNEEYNKIAKVEVQFVVSGTSEQSLPDRLSAAYKAGEKDTDFDLIAIDDSAIANIEAQTSEDFFEEIGYLKFQIMRI